MSSTAFIGGGNMARALVRGLIEAGHRRIRVADPSAEARTAIAALGVEALEANVAAIEDASLVVLAVKPQMMRAVLEPLAERLAARPALLVSIAAGVPRAAIARWSGGRCPVVRCMPNTPALIGAGITALQAGAEVNESDRRRADALLATVGATFWVDEEAMLDVVTAISGSGPAYFFAFMEALAAAGAAMGLQPDLAARLALGTGLGAARLAASPGAPGLAELRRQVTSPGGTTERALAAFAAGGLDELVAAATRAARDRATELGSQLGAGD
jgi:pyrroline-5-carboxylate reductase